MVQDVLSERGKALSRVPLFQVLSPEVRQLLAQRARQRHYAASDFILHQGEPGASLFIVLRGLVKIAIGTSGGSEIVLALLTEGHVFGEMSLLDGQPRSATAVALEPADVVLLTREVFLACLQVYPEAAIALLVEMSNRLRRTNHLVSDIATENLQVRLIHKLLELANSFGVKTGDGVMIGVRLRQQDLAEMVNASREQVNRVLRSLQQEGLVRLEIQRITITEPQELEARLRVLN